MKRRVVASVCITTVLAACAAPADHFYRLYTLPEDVLPSVARQGRAPSLPVRLRVTIPSLVDRSQMVLNAGNSGIVILEHERWGEPLSDQIAQTLARDLESRRPDILIGDARFGQAGAAPVSIKVDVVQLTAARAGTAVIDAHWRIVDPNAGVDALGGDVFTAAVSGADYAAVAKAYSEALSALAGRLAAALRPP